MCVCVCVAKELNIGIIPKTNAFSTKWHEHTDI